MDILNQIFHPDDISVVIHTLVAAVNFEDKLIG